MALEVTEVRRVLAPSTRERAAITAQGRIGALAAQVEKLSWMIEELALDTMMFTGNSTGSIIEKAEGRWLARKHS
jgi:hypothetical protein